LTPTRCQIASKVPFDPVKWTPASRRFVDSLKGIRPEEFG